MGDPLVEKLESLKRERGQVGAVDPLVAKLESLKGPSLLQSVGKGMKSAAEGIGSVYPMVETGLNLLSSMYGVPLSGYAGLAALPFGLETSRKAIEGVQKATIAQPFTEKGKEMSQAITSPFQKLEEGAKIASDFTMDVTDSPLAASGVYAAIQVSPILLGLKSGKGKAPTELMKAKKSLTEKGYPVTKGTMLERVTEKIPPGSWFYEKWQKKLNEMVNKSSEQLVTEKMGLPDPAMIGEFREVANTAWKNMRELVPKDQPINAPNIVQWMKDNPSEMNALKVSKDKTLYSFLSRVDKESVRGGVLFSDLNKINENVWSQNFGKLPANERQVRWQVQQALKADIENIQSTTQIPVWDAYQSAMESSKVVHRAEAGDYINRLIKASGRTDYEKGVFILNPDKLKALVDKNQGNLKRFFKNEPEKVAIVNDFASEMLGATQDLVKFKQQKPSSMFEKAFGGIGGGAATGMGAYYGGKLISENPGGAAVIILPLGAEIALAKSLANPKGWMKKLIYAEPIKGARAAARPIGLGTPMAISQQFQEEFGMAPQ